MILQNKTDAELMEMYQKGSGPAFKALYERHAGKVLGFIKNRIKNEEIASDVFQEVFSKLHKSKSHYKKEYPVLAWLFAITRSAVIDSLRKERKFSERDVKINLDEIPESQNEIPDLALVKPQMARLPDTQRQVLEMRYLEEKTFEKIAIELETTEANVRQLVSRALRKLKKMSGAKHEKN